MRRIANFSEYDYIFLCTPVEYNVSYLKQLKPIISENCIITDVGSVKGNIHKAVLAEDMERNFIGGHPMAGSEKTGYEHANRYILENAYYVITPTPVVAKESVAEFTSLVAATGAIPVQLDYNEHDYAVAVISHVPHFIAAKLVTLVKDSDSPCQTMKMLAAGGFKDITRIASSSPEMWQQICSTNVENITKLMDDYIASMTEIRNSISNHNFDSIYDLFDVSREYRNSFSDHRSGPISKIYALYLDLADESGAICNVARVLAEANLSIKNIGIIHNREFEEGVLKIEFYDNESLDRSTRLLPEAGYTIYRR